MLIGYARVSTLDQNEDLQIRALRQAGCAEVYVDKGVSGTERQRPQLKEVLALLEPGDTLCVWKLDRLGRSMVHLIELLNGFGKRGIGFKSLHESIDTTSAMGKFFFHVLAALAELERDIISERTKAGLDAARARGRFPGRPRRLSSEDEMAIFHALCEGQLLEDVAQRYSVSPRTIERLAHLLHLEIELEDEERCSQSTISCVPAGRDSTSL